MAVLGSRTLAISAPYSAFWSLNMSMRLFACILSTSLVIDVLGVS